VCEPIDQLAGAGGPLNPATERNLPGLV
jgi:hypothetical protein